MTPIATALTAHREALTYFEKHSLETVRTIADQVRQTLESGGIVYLCGNGGSAADAQHIAGEFVGRFKRERNPLPAVAMTTDTSVISCISNDYSYEEIFSRQVDALMNSQDLLWAFSTSGSSGNVMAAVAMAKQKGIRVIGFTGIPDSLLEAQADLTLCAHTNYTSTAQEIHQLAYHIICEIIDQHYTK